MRNLDQVITLNLCRYPEGEGEAPFCCDNSPLPGLAYCATHHKLCYCRPAKRLSPADLDAMERRIGRLREEA
jgi:hypothetical protein